MNIELIVVGKTNIEYITKGIAEYEKRLSKYIKFKITVLTDIKNASSLSKEVLMVKEAELLLKKISEFDYVVLLDENGDQYSSEEFSKWIEHKANISVKNLAFVVGGAYGFHNTVYLKAADKISLSKMTFSHQMIRLLFIEQLYRAMTISRGEPYHHK